MFILGFPEAGVKPVFKCLVYTLSRYHDRKSRGAVEKLLTQLAKCYPEQTLTHFVSILGEIAEAQTTMNTRYFEF